MRKNRPTTSQGIAVNTKRLTKTVNFKIGCQTLVNHTQRCELRCKLSNLNALESRLFLFLLTAAWRVLWGYQAGPPLQSPTSSSRSWRTRDSQPYTWIVAGHESPPGGVKTVETWACFVAQYIPNTYMTTSSGGGIYKVCWKWHTDLSAKRAPGSYLEPEFGSTRTIW